MKKFLRHIFLMLLAATFALSCVSCGSGEAELPSESDNESVEADETESETEPELPAEPTLVTYSPIIEYDRFRFIGRMNPGDEGVFWDYSASGIEFCGEIVGDVVLSLSCDRDTYFTVYVDSERVDERFLATAEDESLTVASFDEVGLHTVKVLRQTEMQWSLAVLESVTVTGVLHEAPANRDILIEFIGDSLTSGYGNLGGHSAPDAGIALYEDGTKTYAFLTAEALGADANVVSCSGIGIAAGWTNFNEMEFYKSASFYRNRDVTYENNTKVPDLVVINLGANDLGVGSDIDAFKIGVRELIEYVRDFYDADIPIVWAYGIVGEENTDYMKTMRAVLEEMGGEDKGLYHVKLSYSRDGGGAHPSLTGHEMSSRKLLKFIKEKGFFE